MLLLYHAPGSKESLGEATNYFTTLNWSAQWRQERYLPVVSSYPNWGLVI